MSSSISCAVSCLITIVPFFPSECIECVSYKKRCHWSFLKDYSIALQPSIPSLHVDIKSTIQAAAEAVSHLVGSSFNIIFFSPWYNYITWSLNISRDQCQFWLDSWMPAAPNYCVQFAHIYVSMDMVYIVHSNNLTAAFSDN